MERAYDDWKAGQFSRDPFQDVMIPTMIDPTMTPPGKHFMSCFVQYAPPKIAGHEWTDADRDAFGQTCLDQIEKYSPGFKNKVLHVEVRTPRELEAEVGLTEGNIFQGELTFDQLLFNRPVPGYAQYRSPIKRPVDLRLLHPSRWWRHGRPRPQRRRRSSARGKTAQHDERRLCRPVMPSSSAAAPTALPAPPALRQKGRSVTAAGSRTHPGRRALQIRPVPPRLPTPPAASTPA